MGTNQVHTHTQTLSHTHKKRKNTLEMYKIMESHTIYLPTPTYEDALIIQIYTNTRIYLVCVQI